MKNNMLIKPFRWIANIASSGSYHVAALRNVYPCKLIGERATDENNRTVVTYRMLGKRDKYTIAIEELLENRDLIAKFHPTEAVKLGAIAMGDILLNMPEENRKQKFKEIKDQMLESTKG